MIIILSLYDLSFFAYALRLLIIRHTSSSPLFWGHFQGMCSWLPYRRSCALSPRRPASKWLITRGNSLLSVQRYE